MKKPQSAQSPWRPRAAVARTSSRLLQGGFSLIELVIVMVIIGILSAYAIPKFMDRDRANLDTTKRRLLSDLAYAQEYAINRHADVSVIFNGGAGSYRIYLTSTGVSLPDPSNRSGTLDFIMNGKDWSGGVAISSASIGGTPGMRFNSWGTPGDSAGTAFSSQGLVILTSGSYADTVRVSAKTGSVR